ncbi:MAG: YceI family protein [Saprospiraceae bacterium]
MASTKWTIDPAHSEINFRVRHMMISTVTGGFDTFSGEAETEGDKFANAKITFTADIDSVNTRNEQRDGHLKSPEFFDSAAFPQLKFVSHSSTTPDADGNYTLTGDLTIRDVTKPVELKVEFGGIAVDPWGNTRAGFEITGEVNRKDFGLVWGAVTETGGVVLADMVRIHCHLELIRAQA